MGDFARMTITVDRDLTTLACPRCAVVGGIIMLVGDRQAQAFCSNCKLSIVVDRRSPQEDR